jgi:hypothetical protein
LQNSKWVLADQVSDYWLCTGEHSMRLQLKVKGFRSINATVQQSATLPPNGVTRNTFRNAAVNLASIAAMGEIVSGYWSSNQMKNVFYVDCKFCGSEADALKYGISDNYYYRKRA